MAQPFRQEADHLIAGEGWKAAIALARGSLHHCEMQPVDLATWPTDLQAVFAAVGRAMGATRLHPSKLSAIPSEFGAVLLDHSVDIVHRPRGEIGQTSGLYQITIKGSRWVCGRWTLRSGELEKLAREASRDLQADASNTC